MIKYKEHNDFISEMQKIMTGESNTKCHKLNTSYNNKTRTKCSSNSDLKNIIKNADYQMIVDNYQPSLTLKQNLRPKSQAGAPSIYWWNENKMTLETPSNFQFDPKTINIKKKRKKLKTQNRLRENRNINIQFNINTMFRPRYKLVQKPPAVIPFYKTNFNQIKFKNMYSNQMRKTQNFNLKGVTKKVFERDTGNEIFYSPIRSNAAQTIFKKCSTSSIKIRCNKNLNRDLEVIEDL